MPNVGFHHTPETRAKMSATRKGRKRSPEERAAISRGKIKQYQENPKEKFIALGDKVPKDTLNDLYIVNGMSTREIAKELGVSKYTVQRYLHWYDIPVRPNSKDPNFKRKEDRYTFYQMMAYDIHGFDRVCQECGTTERIHVHHKDRDRTNNAKENIMILCVSCHAKLHWRASMYNGVQYKTPVWKEEVNES
jgi:5-methylcytosine-specific restriction endonuclease McrA